MIHNSIWFAIWYKAILIHDTNPNLTNYAYMFMYSDTVSCLWSALTQMYAHAHNDACIFELYENISHAYQSALGFSMAEFLDIYTPVGRSWVNMSP